MMNLITAKKLIDLTKANGYHTDNNMNAKKAFSFCKRIAKSHYENFPVASLLVPHRLRPHIYAIYAFARTGDDISDELTKIIPEQDALEALNNYEQMLINLSNPNNTNGIANPIFHALKITIDKFNMPISIFQRLLAAFRQDILCSQFIDMHMLMKYCNNSANPIGELLLYLFDECNEQNLAYSNDICSALQLINFWQDMSIDLPRGRCYVPQAYLLKYNIDTANIKLNEELLTDLYGYTSNLLYNGKNILNSVNNFRFKLELAFIINGGEMIMKKLYETGVDILHIRPKLSKKDWLATIAKSLTLVS